MAYRCKRILETTLETTLETLDLCMLWFQWIGLVGKIETGKPIFFHGKIDGKSCKFSLNPIH